MARLFTLNQTPATSAAAMFILKTQLKTAGWTVPKSSDGSTYNSLGDQISHDGSGANGMDNARAWFVIQQPGSSRSLCIQRYNVTGANSSRFWRVKYSKSVGFTSGSPSATQVPAASDETTVLGSGTDASPSFDYLFYEYDGNFRFNCFAENAAPYGFLSWGWVKTSGGAIHSFGVEPLIGALAEDTDPYVIHAKGDGTTSLSMGSFGITGGQICGWWGSTWFARTGYPTASAGVPTTYGGGVWVWISSTNQPNIISGKEDLYPMTVIGYQTSVIPHYKGILSFVRALCCPARSSGDLFSVSSPKDYVAVGSGTASCAVPWDGSTTPLV